MNYKSKLRTFLLFPLVLALLLVGLVVLDGGAVVNTLAQEYGTSGQAPLPPGVDDRIDVNTGVVTFFRDEDNDADNVVEIWGACTATSCSDLARVTGATFAGRLPDPEVQGPLTDPLLVRSANEGYTVRYFYLGSQIQNNEPVYFIQINVYDQADVLRDDNTILVIRGGVIVDIES
ncbi:MAG: hypothetical protein ACLFTK_04525 [Anaerolineales bacterium]